MRRYETGSITQAYQGRCEDRVTIFDHNDQLIIPYATADSATTFASVSVDELLSHLAR